VTASEETFGVKVKAGDVVDGNGGYRLQKAPAAYSGMLGQENKCLRPENNYLWDDSV
jgi:hypothetical protein